MKADTDLFSAFLEGHTLPAHKSISIIIYIRDTITHSCGIRLRDYNILASDCNERNNYRWDACSRRRRMQDKVQNSIIESYSKGSF
jgi:hypothetical protein